MATTTIAELAARRAKLEDDLRAVNAEIAARAGEVEPAPARAKQAGKKAGA